MKSKVAGRLTAAVAVLSLVVIILGGTVGAGAAPSGDLAASGFFFYKEPAVQPACGSIGINVSGSPYYARNSCGSGEFSMPATTKTVTVEFSQNGTPFDTTPASDNDDGTWSFDLVPEAGWPAGLIDLRILVQDQTDPAGGAQFGHNLLGASVVAAPAPGDGVYQKNEDIAVSGEIFEQTAVALDTTTQDPVPANFKIRVVGPNGNTLHTSGPLTAESDGSFDYIVPGAATSGIAITAATNYERVISIEVVDAAYTDDTTGAWAADRAGATGVTISDPPGELVLENSFSSAVGWVKPGDKYPFRVLVKNFTATPATGIEVTVPPAPGMSFTGVSASGLGSSAEIVAGEVVWQVSNLPAGTSEGPASRTLVVEATADGLGEDPQVVWKDLSTTATLTYATGPGAPGNIGDTSHGPKVIPPNRNYDTARYGDRPFPVVPVDYFDRKHEASHSGETLSNKINSPDVPGSTFNLYQEMSYGQLFPNGTVPSAGVASADFSDPDWDNPKYDDDNDDYEFTEPQPAGACHGTSFKDAQGTPTVYEERIQNGWYQLPGDTDYYGDDKFSVGSLADALLQDIDSACGPTGKLVYDAAHIADPEIDYSDYDTDKDGVVDFFMVVFTGVGGNGESQTSAPPYDNVWPHSSTLEVSYEDEETGLTGYITDDQLRNQENEPLFYTNGDRVAMTTDVTDFPVYVRVGPYNVNPEDAIEKASVISHEYGHSLGLPDFYSGNGSGRESYGDWNLMATDKSQNMDVFSKQEMGWLIPRVLEKNQNLTVDDWPDSKQDVHEIAWKEPDGDPYTLSGPGVHNGTAYVAKLPSKRIISEDKVRTSASLPHLWWSESGNDFGCAPEKGHNLDIYLPELKDLAPGTAVTLQFKSYWDIEWDFDYGFVLTSTDAGKTYQSHPSENGYTTPGAVNPQSNGCQRRFGNGITGSTGSYQANTFAADRVNGEYPDGPFVLDEYDLSALAGQSNPVLRFSYSTDPGLARPGWFIDDLKITAGSDVIYETNFEDRDDPRIFPGGCRGGVAVAIRCTPQWAHISAEEGAPQDHAYYMEMRDRSGFDLSGRNENDRDPIGFQPGLLLTYTDEVSGYGNTGEGDEDPPNQTPLDSQPQESDTTPQLNDAAFRADPGRSVYSDWGDGHTDNYQTVNNDGDVVPWVLKFDCLKMQVDSMAGGSDGPLDPPYDLQGDVTFTMGSGCGGFNYGFGGDEPPATDPKLCPGHEKVTANHIRGTDNSETLRGTNGVDIICGHAGNDEIFGFGGKDLIQGGRGRDVLRGGSGADLIHAHLNRDVIRAGPGHDRAFGGPSHDVIYSGQGRSTLGGGKGRDRLIGGPKRDFLFGEENADKLYGMAGRDRLHGGPGPDLLNGGRHHDRCFGGAGRDLLRRC
jgi:M6 family metalloprotease-like protein